MTKFLKITIFILLLIFLATFLVHKINLPTDDLGRHIKTGEIIWQTKSVPKVNLFSYAEPEHPFINHHWLAELIFYGLYNLIGFSGLIIFKVIILLLTFAIVYSLAIKRGGFFWATLFGFLCILVLAERTDVRPEIFSYLLIALYLLIFYLYEQGKKRAIWWLVPSQLLLVNLHILFFVGIFLILCFIIQQFGPRLKSWVNQKGIDKDARLLVLVLVLSAVVLLINPNFIQGALYPLNVLKNYGYDIVENKSPFYLENLMDNPIIDYFKILITLLIIGFVFNHQRVRIFDFLVSAFAIFMAWFALRNFPIAALLSLHVLALNYKQIFDKLFVWLKQKLAGQFYLLKNITLSVIGVFFIFQLIANLGGQSVIVQAKNKEWGIGLSNGSENAVQFYLKKNLQGPIFNNFDIGSYLDFYLYPKELTFVDNRPEAFTPEFWQFVYIPAQGDENWWQVFNEHYKFNTIFFGYTDNTGWAKSFLNRIIKDENWVTVYLDKHAIILVKNNEINKKLIDEFGLPSDEVKAKLEQYKMKKVRIDYKLEEQRLRGLRYIEENFGPG